MLPINACIFDLDGVIVDTARYHFMAWRRLANELGFDFSEEQNEDLKGISRMESLQRILDWGKVDKPEAERQALAARKNDWYLEYIQRMDRSEILDGVIDFLDDLERHGILAAIGSSSKNAGTILKQIGLIDRFTTISDGTRISKSKPDPEVFLLAAEDMDLPPSACIVFEDAQSGVEAALSGGFYAVGIGEPDVLSRAHLVLPNLQGVSFQDILSHLSQQ